MTDGLAELESKENKDKKLLLKAMEALELLGTAVRKNQLRYLFGSFDLCSLFFVLSSNTRTSSV